MQLKLHMVTIEDLVPEGHFLRKLEATLDLSFVREETAHLYSPKYGRSPIAPVMLVKYLLVGYLYGIPSQAAHFYDNEILGYQAQSYRGKSSKKEWWYVAASKNCPDTGRRGPSTISLKNLC